MNRSDTAFPFESGSGYSEPGLYLRDYFASAAMSSLVAKSAESYEQIVARAYKIADLMCKEREKL